MAIAGILAGGVGSRMGAKLPKQFLKIGDVPIVVRTVKKFLDTEEISRCILAMNEDWIEYSRRMLEEYEVDLERVVIINGGNTRFESLINLTMECQKYDDTIIITHDCARPFVTKEIIINCINACEKFDMATVSVKTIDTVLYSAPNHMESESVPLRDRVFLDQGPQAYPVDTFLKLVEELSDDELGKYMEAGKLFLDKGLRVGIVEGSRLNFKITEELDLSYAEFLLKEGKINE